MVIKYREGVGVKRNGGGGGNWMLQRRALKHLADLESVWEILHFGGGGSTEKNGRHTKN